MQFVIMILQKTNSPLRGKLLLSPVLDQADCLSVGKWTYPQAEEGLPAPWEKSSPSRIGSHSWTCDLHVGISKTWACTWERPLCLRDSIVCVCVCVCVCGGEEGEQDWETGIDRQWERKRGREQKDRRERERWGESLTARDWQRGALVKKAS